MGNFRYAYVVLQIVGSDSLGEESNPDVAGKDRSLTGPSRRVAVLMRGALPVRNERFFPSMDVRSMCALCQSRDEHFGKWNIGPEAHGRNACRRRAFANWSGENSNKFGRHGKEGEARSIATLRAPAGNTFQSPSNAARALSMFRSPLPMPSPIHCACEIAAAVCAWSHLGSRFTRSEAVAATKGELNEVPQPAA
jgi:hypothetical protein